MKLLSTIAVTIALLTSSYAMEKPSAHTKGTPTGKPTGPLKPGEYWWNPQLSPRGPVMVLVSVPQQTMHVYRNGVLIGRSTISSGSKGTIPRAVSSVFSRKRKRIARRNTTTLPCRTCSDLPGPALPCTLVIFPDTRPATAASVSRMISHNCSSPPLRLAAPLSSATAIRPFHTWPPIPAYFWLRRKPTHKPFARSGRMIMTGTQTAALKAQ